MAPQRKHTPLQGLIDLSGKRGIVTGGASGIGLSISSRLAEAGATVVIADIDEGETSRSYEELSEQGYNIIPVHCDAGNGKDIRTMVEVAVQKMGGIDILVNNAGIYPHIPLEQITVKDFERVLQIKPKTYRDKASGLQEIGYIAEELDEVGLNDLVIYDEQDRPNGLKYDRISLYLVELVREQKEKIQELEERVKELEK